MLTPDHIWGSEHNLRGLAIYCGQIDCAREEEIGCAVEVGLDCAGEEGIASAD